MWSALWIALTLTTVEITASFRLKGNGYMSNDPDPRCAKIGQFLVDREDPCSYLVCDYGSRPEKDSKGKHKLFTRKMPCAPGTSVRWDYEKTSKLDGNPCTAKGYACKRVAPRFSAPHGKKFRDVDRQPNAVVKMTITSKKNWTNADIVHGFMDKVWHQITNRMQKLDNRRSLKKYPLSSPPNFKHRMDDLQSLWNEMKDGVEVILRNKAYGGRKTAGHVTRKMRNLQSLWLKMWHKITALQALELASVQREPIPEGLILVPENTPKPKRSSMNKKFELPESFYTEAPEFTTKQGYSSEMNNYQNRPQEMYVPDNEAYTQGYTEERKNFPPDYNNNYGARSNLDRYENNAPNTDEQKYKHPRTKYSHEQEFYPPLSQEFLPPTKRALRFPKGDGYQRSNRKESQRFAQGSNKPYQTKDSKYGDVNNYDSYPIDEYDKPLTDQRMVEGNTPPKYRPYEGEGYKSPYQSQPRKYENDLDGGGYRKNRKRDERPTPPLETIDENTNMDMVPSGFGSHMPLKSLWMEMKGVLGHMMENGKLEAENIPLDEEGEYTPDFHYYDNNRPSKSQQQTPKYRRSNGGPPRRWKYPEGRKLSLPMRSEESDIMQSRTDESQQEQGRNKQSQTGSKLNQKMPAPAFKQDHQSQEENRIHTQAPIVSELNSPPKDPTHPDMNLKDFDMEDFNKAYENSVNQWEKIATDNEEEES